VNRQPSQAGSLSWWSGRIVGAVDAAVAVVAPGLPGAPGTTTAIQRSLLSSEKNCRATRLPSSLQRASSRWTGRGLGAVAAAGASDVVSTVLVVPALLEVWAAREFSAALRS